MSKIIRNAALEEAAIVAEEALGGYLCPYGRDKPGDPTWNHTDKDICPVCGVDSDAALFKCHDTVSGRIAARIRALKSPDHLSLSLKGEPPMEEPKPIRCWHCDFASGYRGMDRCRICDGTGSVFYSRGYYFPNTEAGFRAAMKRLEEP